MKDFVKTTLAVIAGLVVVIVLTIMIGAGEIIGKDKFKFISRKALKDINIFANIINLKEVADEFE